MKTLVIAIVLFAAALTADAQTKNGTWKKTRNNSWPGVVNKQTYWYKLDGNANLLWSADGKSWEADADGMWADNEGSFFKIDENRLLSSVDAGNTWNETPEWKWMAVDSNWYKVDKTWTVWMKK